MCGALGTEKMSKARATDLLYTPPTLGGCYAVSVLAMWPTAGDWAADEVLAGCLLYWSYGSISTIGGRGAAAYKQFGFRAGTIHTMLQQRYWVMKTEPDVYSFSDLLREGSTEWEGVRNYQARNHLRSMARGDYVIIYHSNATPPGAVGIGRIAVEGRHDVSQFDLKSLYHDPHSQPSAPRWTSVTVEPVCILNLVPLARLREMPELYGCALVIRGNRLSVSEISSEAFDAICRAGGANKRSAETDL